jgi:hypothetical protein
MMAAPQNASQNEEPSLNGPAAAQPVTAGCAPDAGLEEEVDCWPLLRLYKPPGSWEKKHLGQLSRPSVWEGLL